MTDDLGEFDDEPLDPDDPANKPLNLHERQFVEEFLHTLNGAEAARRVYGSRGALSTSSASTIAHKVRHRPHVSAAIERGLEVRTLGKGEILARLSDQARADLTPYVEIDEDGKPSFDIVAMRKDRLGHLIKSIKTSPGGVTTITLHDAQAALDKLARIRGMYEDRIQITGEVEVKSVAEALRGVLGPELDEDEDP